MRRIVLSLIGLLSFIGGDVVSAGALFTVPARMVQIESRPGIQNRIIVYRPEQPVATVILFPDGNGRLDITHVFNDPSIGRTDEIPVELMGDLLDQKITVVLADAPDDHRSMLGVNGWHGPGIFRLSQDHARDVGAIVDYLKEQDQLPIWLAGIRMGAFSAATAAIYLQEEVAGLVLAGGITQCTEQKILLQLCPEGLMGMPLQDITVPTLILSGGYAFPENLLAGALSRSPSIRFQTFSEYVNFESWNGWDPGQTAIPGVSNAHVSREMADFIRWNEMTHPMVICDNSAGEMRASVEIYLAGCCY
jgi:hypothetical protein